MSKLTDRFRAIFGYTPLWIVIALCAVWVGCEFFLWSRATLPGPGVEHVLRSESYPEVAVRIAVPEGWKLRQLPPQADSERFAFVPSKGSYPYLLFEIVHISTEELGTQWEQAKSRPEASLFADDEPGQSFYDPARKAGWMVTPSKIARRAEAMVFGDALFRLNYFYAPSDSVTVTTLPKIVDSMRTVASDSRVKLASATTPLSAPNDQVERKFEMSTPGERRSLEAASLNRFRIFGVVMGVLLVMYFGYRIVVREEVEQRIRKTQRMMDSVKRGRPLARDFNPESEDGDLPV